MAKLGINTGTSPDAGDGDALLIGAIKINSNFDEVYNLLGDGTNLAPGIVTSIVAGTNVTVSGATGQVTINASSGGGTSSQWVTTDVGIHTLSNVGIGTTDPTSALTVQGNVSVSGVSTFSGRIGIPTATVVPFVENISNKLILGNDLNIFSTSSSNYILADENPLSIGVVVEDGGPVNEAFFELVGVFPSNDVYYGNNSYATLGFGTEGTKLQTIGAGVTVTGTTFTDQLSVSGVSTFIGSVGIGTTNAISKLTIESTGSASDGELAAHPFAIKQGINDRTLWMGYATNIGGVGFEGAYINAASSGISRPIYLSTRNAFQTPFVGIGTDRDTGTAGQMLQVGGGAYISGNLGIGSANPGEKLQVDGNIRVGIDTSFGVILTSPNGTKYQLFVEDDGTLNTVAV